MGLLTHSRAIYLALLTALLMMSSSVVAAGATEHEGDSEPYEASVPIFVLEEDGTWGQTPVPPGAKATMAVGGEVIAWSDDAEQVKGTLTPGDEYVVEAVVPDGYELVSCWPSILEYQAYPMDADVGTFTAPSRDSSDPYESSTNHWVCIEASTPGEPTFSDVDEDHQFFTEIGWMVDEGLTDGYDDGTFRPDTAVSRQAVVAFLYRSAGEPSIDYSNDFSDVPSSHRFHDAISWAVRQGITDGYDDGTFRPGADVTRQAALAFLHRSVGEPDGYDVDEFSDVPATHRFRTAISWGVSHGVTDGYGDGTFRPGAEVTRQAIAAFLYRMPRTILTGQITDPDGEGVEGAEVTLWRCDVPDDCVATAFDVADADGHVWFAIAEPSTYSFQVWADHAGEQCSWGSEEVEVEHGDEAHIDLTLDPEDSSHCSS